MRPVHHQHLLPVDEWHYLQHFQLVADFVDLVGQVRTDFHQQSMNQQHQSEALKQNRQRQLGHQIVHLDEPDQPYRPLIVPLGPLYLLRRRMIWHP
jgi:hypothetical protein